MDDYREYFDLSLLKECSPALALTNPVRPFLRAVANGRHGETARITIVATPEPANGAPDAFELSEWPREMFTPVCAMAASA